MNMRWRWIEISPTPIPLSEMARYLLVAPRKPRLTSVRPCAPSARYVGSYLAAHHPRQVLHIGSYEQADVVSTGDRGQSKIIRMHVLLAAALAQLGRPLDEAFRPSRPVSRSIRPTPSPAAEPSGRRQSDDPTYLAQLEPVWRLSAQGRPPEE